VTPGATTFTIVNSYPVTAAPPVPETVSSTPTEGQPYTVTITNVEPVGLTWLTSTASSGVTSATTPGFSLAINPAANALTAGTYHATVAIAAQNTGTTTTPLSFVVTLVVNAAPTLTVTGNPVSFGTYVQDFSTPGTATLGVSTTNGLAPATPATFTVTQSTQTAGTPANLLTISGSPGTTTGNATASTVTLSFSAAVANGLTPGTYGGTLAVTVTQAGVTTVPQTVSVPWSVTINPEPTITTSPSATQGIILNVVVGATGTSSITVSAASAGVATNIPITVAAASLPNGSPWLTVTSAPANANTTPIAISASTIGLQADTSYAGQITITSPSGINSPYTIPVTLNVIGLIVTPTTGSFTITNSYPVNVTPIPVNVTSLPVQGVGYTDTVVPGTGGNWLTVSSASGTTAPGTSFTLGVAATANALAPGTYTSQVSVAETGSTMPAMTIVVTLNVNPPATLSVAPTALNFGTFVQNFSTPTTQTLAVSSTNGLTPSTPSAFTVTQTSQNTGTPAGLLNIITTGGTTTGTAATTPVSVSFNAAVANTLAAGTYGGTFAVSSGTTSPAAVAVTWSLTVTSQSVITSSPTSLTFTVPTNSSATSAPITITSGQNIPITVTSSVPWLTINNAPTTANGPAFTVTASTITIAPNSIPYTGAIVVTSANAANSPYSIPVTLTVVPIGCGFTLGSSSASLGSAGTATTSTIPGGALPEVPLTVTLNTVAGTTCGAYTVTSSATWLTATVGASSFTYTAISNAHSTPQTATLTVTNALSNPSSFNQVFTVTEAGDTEALQQRQVRALYESVLGRDPDSGGFAFWTGGGAAGLGQMLDSFDTSPEAFNTDFSVIAAYQAASGAPPTYDNFLASVIMIRNGSQTIPGLFNALTSTKTGYSAATLYQNLLNRAPTTAEIGACTTLSSCFQAIIGNPAPTAPGSIIIVPNNEFQSTCGISGTCTGVGGTTHVATGDHTNSLYIYMQYFTILNRDPDQGGLQFWLNVANGVTTVGGPPNPADAGILFQGSAGFAVRIQILGTGLPNQGFAGSPEFQALYQ
jgi:hypothetical protein